MTTKCQQKKLVPNILRWFKHANQHDSASAAYPNFYIGYFLYKVSLLWKLLLISWPDQDPFVLKNYELNRGGNFLRPCTQQTSTLSISISEPEYWQTTHCLSSSLALTDSLSIFQLQGNREYSPATDL